MKVQELTNILEKTNNRKEFIETLKKHRDDREIFVTTPMLEQKKIYQ